MGTSVPTAEALWENSRNKEEASMAGVKETRAGGPARHQGPDHLRCPDHRKDWITLPCDGKHQKGARCL